MTFGINTKGDYSQMIISSEVDTLTFIGKATFVVRQGVTPRGPSDSPPRWPYYYFIDITYYNFPRGSIYEFTFDSGGRDVVFFVYAPYPSKCSLMRASKDASGIYSISVGSQNGGSTSYVPEVYCFAKTNTVSSGYGINVYKSDGSVSFTTSSKILIVKKYYTGTFPASNLQVQRAGSGPYYTGNSGSNVITVSSIAPVDSISQTITKPILYLPSVETAARYNSIVYDYYFYELLGAYNPSTTNLDLEWVNLATVLSFSAQPTYQSPARNGFAILADGADYD
jgi:hypothetical protein